MRRPLLIAAAIVAALILIVIAVPFLVPADAYKPTIEAQAGKATGRTLTIAGPIHFTLFPVLGLKANDVRLDNTPDAPGGRDFVAMGALTAGVKLWPLLSGRIEITQVTLTRPVIHLVVDAAGRANWTTPATAAEQSPAGGSSAAARFSGLVIHDGTLTYDDAQQNTHRRLDHVDLTIDVTSLDAPLRVDGSLVTNGQTVSIAARVASLKAVREGSAVPVDLSLTAPLIEASFKGIYARTASQGQLKLVTPSLARLAAWASGPMTGTSGLGRLSVEGAIQVAGKTDSFSGLKLVLDGSTLTGTLTLDHSGKVAYLSGALAVDNLDLNRFVSAGGKGASAPAPAAQGWSREPISLSVLEDANADLALDFGRLELRHLKLGHTHMSLHLKDGALSADLAPIALYGGSGQIGLKAREAGGATQIASTLLVTNVAARPFLTDALGISRIEGTASLTYAVSASGRSPDALMHALNGNGQIVFANGRIHGVDLAHIAGEISKVLGKTSLSGTDSDSTVFTDMGGSFTISHGVLSNKDFHMESPFLRMTGAGSIDLGNQTLDYVVKPRAVASLGGQGGNRNAAGFGLPFRIHGPWGHMRYTPDLSGVAQGILESVSQGGISTKSLLNGLFGGGSSNQPAPNSGTPQPQKKPASPFDQLKGLFGGH